MIPLINPDILPMAMSFKQFSPKTNFPSKREKITNAIITYKIPTKIPLSHPLLGSFKLNKHASSILKPLMT